MTEFMEIRIVANGDRVLYDSTVASSYTGGLLAKSFRLHHRKSLAPELKFSLIAPYPRNVWFRDVIEVYTKFGTGIWEKKFFGFIPDMGLGAKFDRIEVTAVGMTSLLFYDWFRLTGGYNLDGCNVDEALKALWQGSSPITACVGYAWLAANFHVPDLSGMKTVTPIPMVVRGDTLRYTPLRFDSMVKRIDAMNAILERAYEDDPNSDFPVYYNLIEDGDFIYLKREDPLASRLTAHVKLTSSTNRMVGNPMWDPVTKGTFSGAYVSGKDSNDKTIVELHSIDDGRLPLYTHESAPEAKSTGACRELARKWANYYNGRMPFRTNLVILNGMGLLPGMYVYVEDTHTGMKETMMIQERILTEEGTEFVVGQRERDFSSLLNMSKI